MTQDLTILDPETAFGSSGHVKPCPHEAADDLVTITTFNRADGFLRDAIGPALAQTCQNIEVIVADSCSSDHTKELVEGFRDAWIDYVCHESNIGPDRNFNFCVERARGKYLCLLHGDDLMDPGFVASCLARARSGGRFGVVQTGTRVIEGEVNILWNTPNRGGGGDGEEFVAASQTRIAASRHRDDGQHELQKGVPRRVCRPARPRQHYGDEKVWHLPQMCLQPGS